jgi:hypothetical protein
MRTREKHSDNPHGERARLREVYPDWLVDYVLPPYVDESGWCAYFTKHLVLAVLAYFVFFDSVHAQDAAGGVTLLVLGGAMVALAVVLHPQCRNK